MCIQPTFHVSLQVEHTNIVSCGDSYLQIGERRRRMQQTNGLVSYS